MADHPVKVPAELVKKWLSEVYGVCTAPREASTVIADRAAQWGADQELEACCGWSREAKNHGFGYESGAELARKLRAARRPKPPTLAEQGLKVLEPPNGPVMLSTPEYQLTQFQAEILRAALNRLAELEAQSDG